MSFLAPVALKGVLYCWNRGNGRAIADHEVPERILVGNGAQENCSGLGLLPFLVPARQQGAHGLSLLTWNCWSVC